MTLHIGRHRFSIEDPDIAVVVFDGDVSADEIKKMYEVTEEQARERGIKQFFVLQDVSRMGAMPDSTRKAMAHDPRAALLAAVACYGASFHVRVTINLVERVVRLLRGKAGRAVFFSTEAEARAWLAEQKRGAEAKR